MMDQPSSEISAGTDDRPAPPAADSPGAALREARERLGLSIADVSKQTKLAPRQIEALEADDFRHLPEMPFVRGFVRSYAKVVLLEADSLLATLPQKNEPPMPLVSDSVEVPFPVAHSPQRQNLIWLGTALLLSVLVVALAVWHFTAPPEKPAEAPVAAPAAAPDNARVVAAPPLPEPAPPATAPARPAAETAQPPVAVVNAPPPAQAAPQTQAEKPVAQPDIPLQTAVLRLVFAEESWTEIRGKDGKVLSSQVNPTGSELRLKGPGPFSLVIGHAASARLYYRGKPVDLAPHTSPESEVARLTLE